MAKITGDYPYLLTVLAVALCSGCQFHEFYVVVNERDEPVEVSYSAGLFEDPNTHDSAEFLSVPEVYDTKRFKKIDKYVALPPGQITVSGNQVTVTLPPHKALLVANTYFRHGSPNRRFAELNLKITTPHGIRSFTEHEVLDMFGKHYNGSHVTVLHAMFLHPLPFVSEPQLGAGM